MKSSNLMYFSCHAPVHFSSGNYAILLSSGLSWYTALLLNFFSSLTAIVGFFVGVAIGTESEESTSWILTIAVGLFLYVALVDLVRYATTGVQLSILILSPSNPPPPLSLLSPPPFLPPSLYSFLSSYIPMKKAASESWRFWWPTLGSSYPLPSCFW